MSLVKPYQPVPFYYKGVPVPEPELSPAEVYILRVLLNPECEWEQGTLEIGLSLSLDPHPTPMAGLIRFDALAEVLDWDDDALYQMLTVMANKGVIVMEADEGGTNICIFYGWEVTKTLVRLYDIKPGSYKIPYEW